MTKGIKQGRFKITNLSKKKSKPKTVSANNMGDAQDIAFKKFKRTGDFYTVTRKR